jgi:hypothetical protein
MAGGRLFDQIFGIGFRIGFLIVLVGLGMFYFQYLRIVLESALIETEIFSQFNSLPMYMRLVIGGIALMGVAVTMSVVKERLEDFINLLFYNDRS